MLGMHFWRVSGHRVWFPNLGPVRAPLHAEEKRFLLVDWLVPFWGAVFGAICFKFQFRKPTLGSVNPAVSRGLVIMASA